MAMKRTADLGPRGGLLELSRARMIHASAIGLVVTACVAVVAIEHTDPVIGTLVVAIGVIVLIRYPFIALSGVLLLTPFSQAIQTALANRAHVALGPLQNWKDLLLIAVFFRAAVPKLVRDRTSMLRNKADALLVLYVAAWILLAIASPARPTIYPAVARYIEGPLLLLAIRFMPLDRRRLRMLLSMMIGAATIMGAAALYERLGPRLGFQRWYGATPPSTGEPFFVGAHGYRSGSFLYDPLVLSFYLAGVAPIAVAIAAVRMRWRIIALIAAAACLGGLLVAATRSGYIGGGIGILVALALVVRNRWMRFAVVGLSVLVAGTATLYYLSAGSAFLNRPGSDKDHREALKRDVTLLVDRPLGYGLGTTDRFRFRPGHGAGQLGPTESTFMATALEGGIQGLALYLIALFATFLRVRAARLRALAHADRDGAALAGGAIGAMVAILLSGLFLGVHEQVIEIVLWGAPGIALAWPFASGRDPSIAFRQAGRSAVLASEASG